MAQQSAQGVAYLARSQPPLRSQTPRAHDEENPPDVVVDVPVVQDPFAGAQLDRRVTSSGAMITSRKPEKVVKQSTTRFEWVAITLQTLMVLGMLVGYIVTGLSTKQDSDELRNPTMNSVLLNLFMLFTGLLGANGANLGISRYFHSQNKNVLRKNGLIAPE